MVGAAHWQSAYIDAPEPVDQYPRRTPHRNYIHIQVAPSDGRQNHLLRTILYSLYDSRKGSCSYAGESGAKWEWLMWYVLPCCFPSFLQLCLCRFFNFGRWTVSWSMPVTRPFQPALFLRVFVIPAEGGASPLWKTGLCAVRLCGSLIRLSGVNVRRKISALVKDLWGENGAEPVAVARSIAEWEGNRWDFVSKKRIMKNTLWFCLTDFSLESGESLFSILNLRNCILDFLTSFALILIFKSRPAGECRQRFL